MTPFKKKISAFDQPGKCLFLQYVKDTSKNNSRYANEDNLRKCPVHLFKLYNQLCPSKCIPSAFFCNHYKRPPLTAGSQARCLVTKSSTIWFKVCAQRLEYVATKRTTLRATTATRLFHAGIDEQLIMETTGHHSVDRVCSYKHTSQEQIANLSDILNVPVKKVHVAPQSTQQQHHAACTNFKGALTAPSPSTVEASLKLLSTVSYHDRCIHCNLHNMRFNTDALNKVYMWGHPPLCGICVFRARRHAAVVCDLCDL